MCLSNVYVQEKKRDKLVIEKANHVTSDSKDLKNVLELSLQISGYYETSLNKLL